MSPELERLFHATVDLEPDARRRYLDQHCTDSQLRQQVERLLTFDQGAEQFLGAPVAALAGRVEHDTPPTAAQRIGPYRIVRQIGRGGMGAVYEGERLDGELRLRVAIKFVPVSLRTAAVVDRFRQERQILANLNHPNVARLLDAGTTEDQSPYLVMELIEGVPIDEWCRDRKLGEREIVELFLPVCSAVSHAHRSLVVHRDLKPANILVDRAGAPKLLDFGIAKLIDEAHRNLQTTLRALTPDYASPEQIAGRPVTTASDTFGLGCVLFRLLTGKTPRRDLKVADAPMPRASSVRPSIASDLDNILQRALQIEPEKRYGTVDALAADLRRFLGHLPVTATPARWTYLAGCFVRRNRLLAITLAALLLSVAAGATVSLWQARRAERRFTELRALSNQFLFQFDERIRDLPGSTQARQFLVSTALTYLERLAGDGSRDPALRRELAAAYRKVSEVQSSSTASSLGDTSGALASIRRARELIEQLPAAERPREEYTRVLIQSADLQEAAGDLRNALDSARRAQKMADEWLRAEPSNAVALELASSSSLLAGRALRRLDSPEEARTAVERALSLDQLAVSRGQGEAASLRLAATLGWRARMQANPASALADQRAAVEILRRLKQSRSVSASADRGLMVGLSRLAAFEQREGSAASRQDALRLLAEAHEIAARRVEFDRQDSRALMDLQSLDTRYGSALYEAGDLTAAERYLAAATRRDLLDRDREAKLGVAIALGWLAELRLARHDQNAAVTAREQARQIFETLLSATPNDVNVLFPFADNQGALVHLTGNRGALCAEGLGRIEHAPRSGELAAAADRLRQACASK